MDMDIDMDLDMDMIWVFVCPVAQTMFEELTSLNRASRSLLRQVYLEALKAWQAQCFYHFFREKSDFGFLRIRGRRSVFEFFLVIPIFSIFSGGSESMAGAVFLRFVLEIYAQTDTDRHRQTQTDTNAYGFLGASLGTFWESLGKV